MHVLLVRAMEFVKKEKEKETVLANGGAEELIVLPERPKEAGNVGDALHIPV